MMVFTCLKFSWIKVALISIYQFKHSLGYGMAETEKIWLTDQISDHQNIVEYTCLYSTYSNRLLIESRCSTSNGVDHISHNVFNCFERPVMCNLDVSSQLASQNVLLGPACFCEFGFVQDFAESAPPGVDTKSTYYRESVKKQGCLASYLSRKIS